jgi:dTDP-4-amino-4,6-dideoxygalactose transaminase
MVPYLDLKAQYRSIKDEVNAAIVKVMESCQFVLGEAVADFEEKFAAYSGARYGVGVNSGTSALHLALLALNIGPGDEVITVPFTFVATVSAIAYAGARPVLVDVEPRSYTIDADQIEGAITERTKAIMPVHLYGQPADMDPILEVAQRHNLAVIEDAAQAHGAEYKGRRCGSMGDIACFSFYPGKNLGAYGEGGAITTNSEDLAQAVRMMRDWGQTKRYHHDLPGFNYRMDGFQGAVLGVKMKYIEDWTEGRRRAAARYDSLIKGAVTPAQMDYARHVYHVYAVQVENRDEMQRKLREAGVATGIHYPIPVHLQKCFMHLGYKRGDFPVSERIADKVLSLPMFAELGREQQRQVASAVQAAMEQM